MPEMPEVETLARKLRKTVIGKRVDEIRLSGLPLRKPIGAEFASVLRGRTISKIWRRGKYLIVEMEPKAYWVIHLGMSGSVLFHNTGHPHSIHTKITKLDTHVHAVVRFSDDSRLEYRDPRRFGLLAAYEVPRLEDIPEIRALGKDPLSQGFTGTWLFPLLQKSEKEIKSFLLDQHKIAGLGNIYVCESLFLARIHPSRRCSTLNAKQTEHLAAAIRKVLTDAIRHKGTTFSDFMDSDGKPGDNQQYLTIFQREGEECFKCGEIVRRIRQGGRSSFFCAHCQN
jgi:formamidopyrimidine-DNA glycosylase